MNKLQNPVYTAAAPTSHYSGPFQGKAAPGSVKQLQVKGQHLLKNRLITNGFPVPTVQLRRKQGKRSHSVAVCYLAGVLVTDQTSPQEGSRRVSSEHRGHCHRVSRGRQRMTPPAARGSLWRANWYPDYSPLRIT